MEPDRYEIHDGDVCTEQKAHSFRDAASIARVLAKATARAHRIRDTKTSKDVASVEPDGTVRTIG